MSSFSLKSAFFISTIAFRRYIFQLISVLLIVLSSQCNRICHKNVVLVLVTYWRPLYDRAHFIVYYWTYHKVVLTRMYEHRRYLHIDDTPNGSKSLQLNYIDTTLGENKDTVRVNVIHNVVWLWFIKRFIRLTFPIVVDSSSVCHVVSACFRLIPPVFAILIETT